MKNDSANPADVLETGVDGMKKETETLLKSSPPAGNRIQEFTRQSSPVAGGGGTEEKTGDVTAKADLSTRIRKTAASRLINTPPRNARSHELNTLIGGTIQLELKKPHMVKSMAFLSNKGGVGKTHIASNMAFYMHRLKKKALLIDLDLGTADVTNKLGFYCESTIYDMLTGKRRHDQIIYTTPYGFHLIGGESGNLRLANLVAPQKRRVLRLLREIGHDYDFVIYDLSAGISSTTLDFALAQDYQIIVTTPQDIVAGYSCIKAAYYRFQEVETKMAERDPSYKPRTNFRPFIILNQVPTFAIGKELFEKIVAVTKHNIVSEKGFTLDINLLGVIASDPSRVREAELHHFLYSGKHGATHTGQCFHFLAHNLIQYRDPNSMEFTTKLERFANLFMKTVEETKYAQ
jgi:MinD-like ATPase involved in chromosome partitioning or flagellar assembly